MTPELKTALVDYARMIVEHRDILALEGWQHHTGMCGCMGPQNGEPLCPCEMSRALGANLVVITHEIEPEAALRIMRRKIIAALR